MCEYCATYYIPDVRSSHTNSRTPCSAQKGDLCPQQACATWVHKQMHDFDITATRATIQRNANYHVGEAECRVLGNTASPPTAKCHADAGPDNRSKHVQIQPASGRIRVPPRKVQWKQPSTPMSLEDNEKLNVMSMQQKSAKRLRVLCNKYQHLQQPSKQMNAM